MHTSGCVSHAPGAWRLVIRRLLVSMPLAGVAASAVAQVWTLHSFDSVDTFTFAFPQNATLEIIDNSAKRVPYLPGPVTRHSYAGRISSGPRPDSWPGVSIRRNPTGHFFNLSNVKAVAADLTNLGDTYITMTVKLIDSQKRSYEGYIQLAPGAFKSVALPFFNVPTPYEFGIHELPGAWWESSTNPGVKFIGTGLPASGFDISRVTSIEIFAGRPRVPVNVAVDYVRIIHDGFVTQGGETSYSQFVRGLVDPYGQNAKTDFPDKYVPSDSLNPWRSSLPHRHAVEDAELGTFRREAGQNEYLGDASRVLTTGAGYFRTFKVGTRWNLVDPSGAAFYSVGINSVDPQAYSTFTETNPGDSIYIGYPAPTIRRQDLFVSLPHDVVAESLGTPDGNDWWPAYNHYLANLKRKFGQDPLSAATLYRQEWQKLTARRMIDWGFNTLGAWSLYSGRYDLFYYDGVNNGAEWLSKRTGENPPTKIPYTMALKFDAPVYVKTLGGKQVCDPYVSGFQTSVRGSIDRWTTWYPYMKTDPWLIGYFVDNEPPFMDDQYGTMTLPGGIFLNNISISPAKQAFINWLKNKYPTIAQLNGAWGTNFSSYDSLNSPFQLNTSTSTAALQEDCHELTAVFAEKWMKELNAALKAVDPNHLNLGARLNRWTQRIAERVSRHCNVLSLNAYGPDLRTKAFNDLKSLNKPLLVTEFHTTTTSDGFHGGGQFGAFTQDHRAESYEAYAQSAFEHPNIVGYHFYQLVDFPLSGGAFNGENHNVGLLSVTDTPYARFIEAVRRANRRKYTATR